MVFDSSHFWQPVQFHIIPSNQIQYSLQRNYCTNPVLQWCMQVWPQIKLHGIPNLQEVLPHSFNSRCKNNTHFPLTYCVGCLNFHKETTPLAITVYLAFITKLREHYRLCSLTFRDQKKPFIWGRKYRFEWLLYLHYYQTPLFFLEKGKSSIFWWYIYIYGYIFQGCEHFWAVTDHRASFPFWSEQKAHTDQSS